MAKQPIKIRIIDYMSDGIERWSSDIVSVMCAEYNISMTCAVSRDYINFNLIELAANGFLKSTDEMIDTEGKYKKDALLFRYVITDAGKERAEALRR
ncbi:hypothetical protein J5839_04430 [Methanosarcinaceae archaeon]|nr:hypothetical protein [Methanosarcinaceae archaeon]MBQ3620309.1 hypothetical protein [Methanosarcinaceae archaeon]